MSTTLIHSVLVSQQLCCFLKLLVMSCCVPCIDLCFIFHKKLESYSCNSLLPSFKHKLFPLYWLVMLHNAILRIFCHSNHEHELYSPHPVFITRFVALKLGQQYEDVYKVQYEDDHWFSRQQLCISLRIGPFSSGPVENRQELTFLYNWEGRCPWSHFSSFDKIKGLNLFCNCV